MVWVCVDKDGTEKITNSIPVRRTGIKSVMWGLFKGWYSKNSRNKWADGWSSDEKDFLPFRGIILPKGSIEKLIGYRLTWADEPVELKEVNS